MKTQIAAMVSKAAAWLNRIPRWLLIALVSLMPALATLLLIAVCAHGDLTHFMPLDPIINDQVYNWHQILTFSATGLNGGYYVVNEVPAAFSPIHFSAAGPMFPAIYGTIAHFTGWQAATGVYFNLIILTLSTWIFLRLTRFDRVQILLTGFVLLSVTPILLYVPALMQESLHQGAALILAGVFYRLFFVKQKQTLLVRCLIVLFFLVLSLTRFSWVFLLLPFLFLSSQNGSRRRLLQSVLITGLVTVGVLAVFQRITSPGNNSIFNRLIFMSSSPGSALSYLIGTFQFNLREMFVPDGKPFTLDALTIFHIEYLVFILVAYVIWYSARRKPVPEGASWAYSWEGLFNFYNLGVLLLAALTFYLPSGYHRVFAPHLLIALLIWIAFKHYRLIAVFLLVSLISIGASLNSFTQDRAIQFQQDDALPQIERMRQTLSPYLVYNADTDNAWCNTLLLPVRFLDARLMAVPAGIGISFFRNEGPAFPLKSHYLLLGAEEYQQMQADLHVEPLAQLDDSTLYRNLDADCDETGD